MRINDPFFTALETIWHINYYKTFKCSLDFINFTQLGPAQLDSRWNMKNIPSIFWLKFSPLNRNDRQSAAEFVQSVFHRISVDKVKKDQLLWFKKKSSWLLLQPNYLSFIVDVYVAGLKDNGLF